MTNKRWGDARHLTKALFAQDKIWVTASSDVRKISEMDPTHCLNTLLMLERMDDLPVAGLQDTPLYTALKARVVENLSRPTVECSGSIPDKLRMAQRYGFDVLLDYQSALHCRPRREVRFSNVALNSAYVRAVERGSHSRRWLGLEVIDLDRITSCEIIPNSGGNP